VNRTSPGSTLDPSWIGKYRLEISKTLTRRELDELTRRIWRMWDTPVNKELLESLKTSILCRRDVLARNDPR
jgi:hypothetical protein